MKPTFKRTIVCQITCPSCDNGHWIDVYKEDGKYYTMCFGIDIEPCQLTDQELKHWNVPLTTTPSYAE